VVDDDHVHAELPRTRDLGDAGDAAVQGDEEPGALPGDALDGSEVEPVALVDPMRDVRPGSRADRLEEEREQRGGADPVDVVVAVEGDLLPLDDGAGEALDRGGHALHAEGVGKVGELVGEEPGGVLGFSDAASDEDARGERVQADLDGKTAGGATAAIRRPALQPEIPSATGNSSRANARRFECSYRSGLTANDTRPRRIRRRVERACADAGNRRAQDQRRCRRWLREAFVCCELARRRADGASCAPTPRCDVTTGVTDGLVRAACILRSVVRGVIANRSDPGWGQLDGAVPAVSSGRGARFNRGGSPPLESRSRPCPASPSPGFRRRRRMAQGARGGSDRPRSGSSAGPGGIGLRLEHRVGDGVVEEELGARVGDDLAVGIEGPHLGVEVDRAPGVPAGIHGDEPDLPEFVRHLEATEEVTAGGPAILNARIAAPCIALPEVDACSADGAAPVAGAGEQPEGEDERNAGHGSRSGTRLAIPAQVEAVERRVPPVRAGGERRGERAGRPLVRRARTASDDEERASPGEQGESLSTVEGRAE
jgi:hypothetical protein